MFLTFAFAFVIFTINIASVFNALPPVKDWCEKVEQKKVDRLNNYVEVKYKAMDPRHKTCYFVVEDGIAHALSKDRETFSLSKAQTTCEKFNAKLLTIHSEYEDLVARQFGFSAPLGAQTARVNNTFVILAWFDKVEPGYRAKPWTTISDIAAILGGGKPRNWTNWTTFLHHNASWGWRSYGHDETDKSSYPGSRLALICKQNFTSKTSSGVPLTAAFCVIVMATLAAAINSKQMQV